MGDVARMLLQEGVLTREAAARAVAAARGGDVASAALDLRLADEPDIVAVLARSFECPGVDLSASIVPAGNVDAVPLDFCRDHRLIPVSIGRSEIVLAMANPDDLGVADEVRFVTARKILRYAAVGSAVLRALDGVERVRKEGGRVWRGDHAPVLPDPLAAHVAAVKPADPISSVELPEANEAMEIVGLAEVMTPFAQEPPPAPPPATGPASRRAAGPRAPQAPIPAGTGDRPTLRLDGSAVGKVAVVADDDEDVRRLVAAVLQRLGCVVLPAADGAVALETARDARPDLLVLDAMMPALHGFEVCRLVKADEALRGTRVVLLSAVYRGTVGADAQATFGADAFVEKPFKVDEVTRVFKLALLGSGAETAEERAARAEGHALWRAAAEALALEHVEDAVSLARDAIARDPWSAEAHYYLGHALSKQGLLFEAVAAYERAAELRPDVDAAHQCLAQVYERLGFQKSAREAWARAAETCKDPVRKKAMHGRLMKLLGA